MAISPPSDIVLDVLNNADPSRLEVAQAQLKAGQATAEAKRLASTDASFNATLMKDAVSDAHKLKHRLDGVEKKEVPETYRKFEAMRSTVRPIGSFPALASVVSCTNPKAA